ncbi:MAG: hypothetical protein ACWGNV_03375 [Bacteroidales bacterium]
MKLKGRGLIPTIVYHLLLLLLLIFAGLTYPVPPPEEEGILVNFGTDDTGFGTVEPAGDVQQAGDPELPVTTASSQPEEEAMPPVAEQTPTVEPEPVRPTPEPVREDLTQDVEETKVIERPQPTPEELERQRQEKERLEQERLEQQRLEQERIERERIEREKREEEERIARERQQQAQRINNAGQSAFGNQGAGTTQGSEGVTEGSGNQGVTSGTPGADNYGTGGGLGNGISFGLGNRRVDGSLPKPNMSGCDVTQKIEVQVDIQVDREGRVVSAVVSKATYQDKCIWDMVVDAAKRSRFTPDENASYRQAGWIRYIITP